MSNSKRPQVLCVDDEARVVEGLTLHLRKDYEVHTALSGEAGLQKLKELGGVAVVISDMRMPGMDGATFLKRVMRAYPDATRMLLTGEPGRDAAVQAVNEAQIYRFLTKPCPPEQLKAAVDAAVIQHQADERGTHDAAGDGDRVHSGAGRCPGDRQSDCVRPREPDQAAGDAVRRIAGLHRVLATRSGGHAVAARISIAARRSSWRSSTTARP